MCIYDVWHASPMFTVHLCCLVCFTNVICCSYCLTSFTNVDVQLSVSFLGPLSICFPNVTCCSCCLTCFPNVTCCCFSLWMHPDRWFRGCTQFEENASKRPTFTKSRSRAVCAGRCHWTYHGGHDGGVSGRVRAVSCEPNSGMRHLSS